LICGGFVGQQVIQQAEQRVGMLVCCGSIVGLWFDTAVRRFEVILARFILHHFISLHNLLCEFAVNFQFYCGLVILLVVQHIL